MLGRKDNRLLSNGQRMTHSGFTQAEWEAHKQARADQCLSLQRTIQARHKVLRTWWFR